MKQICIIVFFAMLAPGVSADEPDPSPTPVPWLVTPFGAADVTALLHEEALYVSATSGCLRGGALPIWKKEPEAEKWRLVSYILSGELPTEWIGACDFWAPEIHLVNDQYIAYFSARDQNLRFVIGAAAAEHPAGPYRLQPSPMVSASDCGVIDPHLFRDPQSDQLYLLWKEDRNDLRAKEQTPIKLGRASEDGLALDPGFEPFTILINDDPWEGDLVEAPQLIYREPYYYLFYSGNAFFDERYGVGVARASDILGPYEKYDNNPILKSSGVVDGPGHPYLFFDEANKNWVVFYHARIRGVSENLDPLNNRLLLGAPLKWDATGWCRPVSPEPDSQFVGRFSFDMQLNGISAQRDD